jgi:hypothetical protein
MDDRVEAFLREVLALEGKNSIDVRRGVRHLIAAIVFSCTAMSLRSGGSSGNRLARTFENATKFRKNCRESYWRWSGS